MNADPMIRIRRIGKGEFRLYRAIRLQSLLESPHAFGTTYGEALQRTDASWMAQCDALAKDSDKCSLIAFQGETPVGISSAYRTSEAASEVELMQVWVSPDHRGRGVAKRIFMEISAWAIDQGFRKISVRLKKTNRIAKLCYEKFGFVTVAENATEDELSMEIDLKRPQ